jgi:hypothetical protein
MKPSIVREAELRRAVIDRMIDASVNTVQETRDADLERWRQIAPEANRPARTAAAD